MICCSPALSFPAAAPLRCCALACVLLQPMGARHPLLPSNHVVFAHSFKPNDKVGGGYCLVDKQFVVALTPLVCTMRITTTSNHCAEQTSVLHMRLQHYLTVPPHSTALSL